MKRHKVSRLVLLCTALALTILASVLTADGPAGCNTYYNSRASWVQYYGPVCAYTGAGCTECYGPGGSPVCVENGGGSACLDYQY